MFNFTPAETKALLFTVIILLVSGVYQLISPNKSLQPSYDYSASDSVFKRISQEITQNAADSIYTKPVIQKIENTPSKQKSKTVTSSAKNEKLLFSSIDINTASENELQKLPRIGPAKAKLIVEYRTTYGNFNNIDDLLKIKGIGKKTLEKLKPFIVVN